MTGRQVATTSWPLSRIIGGAVLLMTLFSVLAVVVGAVALAHLDDQRQRIEATIDPAALSAQQLYTALVNQETGVRGYALSGQPDFLAPYTEGMAAEKAAVAQLAKLLPQLPAASATDLKQALNQANDWRSRYAQPTIKQIQANGKPVVSPDILAGKAEFDALRTKLAVFESGISSTRQQALGALDRAAGELDAALLAIAIGLVVVVAVLAVVLRATAIRPVHVLAAEARRVADGDFRHEVAQSGPREIRGLGADVNTMRLRILHELSAVQHANESLAVRAEELQRSNAELEQFAYVASHDLQEPLRKVTSFCQLLQRRYGGQLDERADQYIEFAVDGAKRMQVLINDLLAFSRVGRTGSELAPVSGDAALASAKANLAAQIEQAGAVIEATPLPTVTAQQTLLSAVFQNLLGNALKFRGDQPPHVVVTAERDRANWLFSVTDNGIGIDPQYADRVFLIFQRLHDKTAYPGTGIGLAMCRKIIEYFGGRIWLDTEVTDGTRFRFTLPAMPETVLAGSTTLPGDTTLPGKRGPMNYPNDLQPIDVLLVEDDAGDVLMTREAFEFYKIRNTLHVVTDGEQALQFLRQTGPYEDAPRPGLILLDVNLPKVSGLEVLAELKQDPALLAVPVVMLTTSQADEDILRSYKLHANAYVSKPVDFEAFTAAIRQIDDFFLTLVQLPS